LKQLGLALLHGYHDAVGSLPWGQGPFGWNDGGAAAMLLPGLEQRTLFDSINSSADLAPAMRGCPGELE
jgi:Protein of unknown function (DUF1559)